MELFIKRWLQGALLTNKDRLRATFHQQVKQSHTSMALNLLLHMMCARTRHHPPLRRKRNPTRLGFRSRKGCPLLKLQFFLSSDLDLSLSLLQESLMLALESSTRRRQGCNSSVWQHTDALFYTLMSLFNAFRSARWTRPRTHRTF